MEEKTQSSFVVERSYFNDSDLYKMVLYSASSDNQSEAWEINIGNGWVNGFCKNKDEGMFWKFLIENKLDDRIEIIRC